VAAEPALTRRRFLQVSFTAGGALLIGVDLSGCSPDKRSAHRTPVSTATTGAPPADNAFSPNLFVRIDPDDSVTLTVHRSEMGQGVRTALAMIVAEELEVDWAKVRTVQSPANTAIGQQRTSGSGSVTDSYDLLLEAGATGRGLLVAAAASTWGVAPSECEARKGTVVRTATSESRTYGSLVRFAKQLKTPPVAATLKDPKQFRLIGTSLPRVEQPAIVTGAAVYGLDVRVPHMLFAAVARSPVPGGTVKSFDAGAATKTPGVRKVVKITSGVAVVADTSWAAFQGRDALRVEWDEGALNQWSSASIGTALADALQPLVTTEGPLGPRMLEAVYDTPYLAHAPMEPLSCVADVRAKHCEVWCPTQNPQDVQSYVAKAVGVPTDVHVTMIGGGFGRRLEVDFAIEAAETSKAVGAPVQVTWTRTDDLRHDYYRPPSRHWMRAGWDAGGAVTLWRHKVAGPGLNGVVYQVGRDLLLDGLSVPYNVPDSNTDAAIADVALPTGPWRAVLDGPNAFANECFFDEVGAALHQDPLALRMKLLSDSDLMRPVLALAASKAGWNGSRPGRGIACHTRVETPIAMVADVSVHAGQVRVERVVCAVDCGTVVNPDMVVQQIEGGVVFGLTALLKDPITFEHGRVQQHNFDDYRLLQMREMPAVEVHIVPSTRAPQGVGEMGVPPIAPAVANALFTLTGKRVRRTPVQAADL
jgi:isoquinoline 1-oxidoreductase beta subunit